MLNRRHLLLASASLLAATRLPAAEVWLQGKHYFQVSPAQPTTVGQGLVEVREVFSYGCPACEMFRPLAKRIAASLPANARLVYTHASFLPRENWPMFQRAYLTALQLGVADRAHEAMFDAVWHTGELAIADPRTGRLVNPLPTLGEAAQFYKRVAGVEPGEFIALATSPYIDEQVRKSDDYVLRTQSDRTPTIIVNGKFRLHQESAGGPDELVELVKYLVAQESAARR